MLKRVFIYQVKDEIITGTYYRSWEPKETWAWNRKLGFCPPSHISWCFGHTKSSVDLLVSLSACPSDYLPICLSLKSPRSKPGKSFQWLYFNLESLFLKTRELGQLLDFPVRWSQTLFSYEFLPVKSCSDSDYQRSAVAPLQKISIRSTECL